MAKSIKGKKLKVVAIIGQLASGGTERQLTQLYSKLASPDFDCQVIVVSASNDATNKNALKRNGIIVWDIPAEIRKPLPRLLFIYKLLRQLSPDIVHSWTFHNNPYAGIAGFFAGVPVRFGSLRNSMNLEGTRNLSVPYKLFSLYTVQKLFVNAESISLELTSLKYPEKRIVILPNGIDLEIYDNVSTINLSSCNINPQTRIIGFVGNLRRVKNPALFVDAMAVALGYFDDAMALIIGQPVASEPGVQSELLQQIRDYGLEDRVILMGHQNNIPELMAQMSIVCITSISEGLPNVLLEAMATGCPVISTAVGGIPNILEHGITGYLVPSGDIDAIAEFIIDLLTHPAKGARLGEAGRRQVEKLFRLEYISRQLKRVYQDSCTKGTLWDD